MNKLLEEFKGTGEYNQMYTRMKNLVEVASGYLPMTAAMQVTTWLYVEVRPSFDDHTKGLRRTQTGWELLFITEGLDGVFRFHTITNSKCVEWVRKKDGKAKAAEKFTDATFLYLFENGCVGKLEEE